ncbi:MAG: glutamine--fructose-6-phosphate transaminase (isomerizing) [Dehalococcoidia bacterium]|nr:glutamine--fructose-6-phosphate transaminase (isomerizing) [Dehalococcoidia bacterium]
MCGIVGYLGPRDAWSTVLDALRRLEYRGYDSSGIAVLTPGGRLEVHKSAGKVRELTAPGGRPGPKGHLGLGHTRWATHGRPTDANAHPHTDCKGRVAVVHNGIVENYLQLRERLQTGGHAFTSETDSEVIAHLIEEGLEGGLGFEGAFLSMKEHLLGSQAIVAAMEGAQEKTLMAARLGHAGGIVLSHRPGEAAVSSDLAALLPLANSVTFLEDGETAVVREEGIKYLGQDHQDVLKTPQPVPQGTTWAEKGGYRHFMLKEIMEQPQAVAGALRDRVDFQRGEVTLDALPLTDAEVRDIRRVVLVGCGTSLYAAMVGRHYMEELAGVNAEVDSASEYRYRNIHVDRRTLVVSIGQSGETADTLAAMAAVRGKGGRLVTICNAEGSQATRLAEGTLYMRAGPEIGVASTKTFIASLTVLALLAIHLGRVRGALSPEDSRRLLEEMARLPNQLGGILAGREAYGALARRYHRFDDFLYMGRGITHPIALEGALKLKEIGYIHAEGYPAGEMKHGPIALIDPRMPVVAVAPQGSLHGKMANNVKEVKARDGSVIAVVSQGDRELASQVDEVIEIPACHEMFTPMLAVAPLQLLAYYIAVRRGCDVDQPRNLAKSVTVE